MHTFVLETVSSMSFSSKHVKFDLIFTHNIELQMTRNEETIPKQKEKRIHLPHKQKKTSYRNIEQASTIEGLSRLRLATPKELGYED